MAYDVYSFLSYVRKGNTAKAGNTWLKTRNFPANKLSKKHSLVK